jgi:hypothetical protein
VLAWALSAFFASVFMCVPVSANWDLTVKNPVCINYDAVTLAIGILNVLIDFTMLGLPIPLLWDLRMSIRRRVFLILALGAGSIACVVSIVRLTYAKDMLSSSDASCECHSHQTILFMWRLTRGFLRSRRRQYCQRSYSVRSRDMHSHRCVLYGDVPAAHRALLGHKGLAFDG